MLIELRVAAQVTVCSISIPRTLASILWDAISVCRVLLVACMEGREVDTSHVVDSRELTTSSDIPRSTTLNPHVVDTAMAVSYVVYPRTHYSREE